MDDGQSEDLPSCGISAVAKPPESPRGEPRQNKAGPPRFSHFIFGRGAAGSDPSRIVSL